MTDEYYSFAQYMERTHPIVGPMITMLRFRRTCERTRRTVEVTARKHKARRRRRRR